VRGNLAYRRSQAKSFNSFSVSGYLRRFFCGPAGAWDGFCVVLASGKRNGVEPDRALRAGDFGIGELVFERITVIAGGELLADIVGQVKGKSIGVMTKALIDMTSKAGFALVPGECDKDRHVVDERLAARIERSENVAPGHRQG
jgi:hypothetical protein